MTSSADPGPHDAAFEAILADARGDGRAFLAAAFDFAARRTPFFTEADASKQLARLLRDVRAEHGGPAGSGLAGGFLGGRSAEAAPTTPAAAAPPPPPPLHASTTITEIETDAEPAAGASAAPEPAADAASSDDDDTPASTGLPPNAGNGADLPTYSWTQTLSEVVVTVPVPAGTRAAACDVAFTRTHLRAGLKGADPILAGPTDGAVLPDDCTWSLQDGRLLEITLAKADTMRWWARVVEGQPGIDVTQVQPENSKLGDLDAETRATVEKMMWDQRQKALGRPTSEEEAKLAAIEKFKAAHPELDFSGAKIGL